MPFFGQARVVAKFADGVNSFCKMILTILSEARPSQSGGW